MTAARDRKEAAKRLDFTLQAQYRALLEASTPDEVQNAAIVLGGTFNDNIEFVFWVLKEFGGVQQMPFERLRKPSKPANDLPDPDGDTIGGKIIKHAQGELKTLPATPAIFLNGKPN